MYIASIIKYALWVIVVFVSYASDITTSASQHSNISNQSWHVFKSDHISKPIYEPYVSRFAQSIRQAWNLPSLDISSAAYQELEFDRAMDIIYKHQHPQDCMAAKYLVSEGYSTGFGSEIHVDGLGLALAMEQGRIYMPFRRRDEWLDKQWQTPSKICGGDNTLFCYFEPWSNCTYEHVDRLAKRQPKIRNYRYSPQEKEFGSIKHKIALSALERMKNETVARTILPAEFEFHRLIPHQLEHLIHPDIPQDKRYYWWRAISAAYLIRPNKRTQKYIRALSTPGLHELNGQCVSMYIRHGDKAREMKLQSFSVFARTADLLWKYMDHNKSKKTIFFGTETPQVVKDAETWGRENNWRVVYNPLQQEIFNKSNSPHGIGHLHGRNEHHRGHKHKNSHVFRRLEELAESVFDQWNHSARLPVSSRSLRERSDYEFLSMIINLADLMKCDAYVCTLMSNYCRLLDEFRAVVAAKPHALFADLSQETCSQPPCIGPDHIKTFDW